MLFGRLKRGQARCYAVVDLILILNAIAAILAVLFIALYLGIIVKAEEIGPAPMSWILFAVGSALIAASAVLEAAYTLVDMTLVFHLENVYFMFGNVILFAVLFRLWKSIGGTDG